MFEDFKKFAMRGNVMDMAVGIILGAAFGAIVSSLVSDVIMPPVGWLLGQVEFNNLFLVLREGKSAGPYETLKAAQEAGAVTINYGLFLNRVVNFVIVAWAVFLLIRGLNRLARRQAPPPVRLCPDCATGVPAAARRCPHCTSQIAPA